MTRKILPLLFFTMTSICFAGTDVLHFKNIVEIDGKNKEWSSPLPSFDKKTGINYSVANDLSNLYFILRITDNSTIQQITQNGLEIWINKDGKKKKVTGVTFPLPIKPDAGKTGTKPSLRRQGENPDMEQVSGEHVMAPKMANDLKQGMGRKGPLPNNELKLTGFLIDNGQQPLNGCKVRAAASIDDYGCLIYELAVPFNTFYKEKLDQDDIETKFYIGFVIKAADSSTEESMSGGMMGGGPGGMGGGPGGMGGGPGGPGGMGPMGGNPEGMGSMSQISGTSTEKTFWFKVIPSLQ
jgi:hypothetical protein